MSAGPFAKFSDISETSTTQQWKLYTVYYCMTHTLLHYYNYIHHTRWFNITTVMLKFRDNTSSRDSFSCVLGLMALFLTLAEDQDQNINPMVLILSLLSWSSQQKQAVRPVVRPTQYARARCKWWLEQPPKVAWWPCPLTFLTLELVCNVTLGMDNLPANFVACATFLCRVMGKHASNWWRNLDLWPLRSPHGAYVGGVGHPTVSVYQVWSLLVSPLEDMADFLSQH